MAADSASEPDSSLTEWTAPFGGEFRPNPKVAENYSRLIDRLTKIQEHAKSQGVKQTVGRSLRLASECVQEMTFAVSCVKAYLTFFETWLKEQALLRSELLASVKAQTESVQQIEDEAFRILANQLGILNCRLGVQMIDSNNEMAEQLHSMMPLVANILQETFVNGLCGTDDLARSKRAVGHLIQFLLGLTSLGTFIDGLERIKEILSGDTAGVSKADEVLASLEQWNVAAWCWLVSTRFMCHNLAHFNDPKSQIDIDAAKSLIEQRLAIT